MTVNCMLTDGTITPVPCEWHPEHVQHDIAGDSIIPAGLWASLPRLRRRLESVNEYRKGIDIGERDLSDIPGMINFAEAPFELIDSEDPDCWKHNGLTVKNVQYGGWSEFWRNS